MCQNNHLYIAKIRNERHESYVSLTKDGKATVRATSIP